MELDVELGVKKQFTEKYLLLLLAVVSILSTSCGKGALPWEKQIVETQSVARSQAEAYSYELGNNSCSTGAHSFNTMVEICQALLDDELNNNCVAKERLRLHKSNCEASESV